MLDIFLYSISVLFMI